MKNRIINRSIQIDEMVFKRGQLIRNSTFEKDQGILWILFAIEEQN